MTTKKWTCKRHGTRQTSYCEACMEEFRNRREATTMTVAERADELETMNPQLTIPFSDLHLRITELMGRDVWTHELAHPEQLVAELRSGDRASLAEVIAKLPQDKVIFIGVESDQ